MTQEKLRQDLNNIEKFLKDKSTEFMHDLYLKLRSCILKELLKLQIKEFSYD